MKNTESLIRGIDWKALREQKAVLVNMIGHVFMIGNVFRPETKIDDHLDGLVVLIDNIQDCAVDVLGIPTEEVFNLTPGTELDYYLILMWRDVEPSLRGPFLDDSTRTDEARKIRKEDGDERGLYRLNVPKGVKPDVDSFTGGEIEP